MGGTKQAKYGVWNGDGPEPETRTVGTVTARSPENFCGFFLRICLGILQ